MRKLIVATVISTALAASSAHAQGSYVHHSFCLLKGSDKECAYDSMAQCEASRTGTSSCVPNSPQQNH